MERITSTTGRTTRETAKLAVIGGQTVLGTVFLVIWGEGGNEIWTRPRTSDIRDVFGFGNSYLDSFFIDFGQNSLTFAGIPGARHILSKNVVSRCFARRCFLCT